MDVNQTEMSGHKEGQGALPAEKTKCDPARKPDAKKLTHFKSVL